MFYNWSRRRGLSGILFSNHEEPSPAPIAIRRDAGLEGHVPRAHVDFAEQTLCRKSLTAVQVDEVTFNTGWGCGAVALDVRDPVRSDPPIAVDELDVLSRQELKENLPALIVVRQ